MGRLSKQKGSSFERSVATALRKRLKLRARDLYRTPLSGGHHEKGDIIVAAEHRRKFPWCVECKHAKLFHIEAAFKKTEGVMAFLKQAAEQTEGRPPLLVARGNNTETYAFIRSVDYRKRIKENFNRDNRHFRETAAPRFLAHFRFSGEQWVVMFWRDFLKALK